VTFHLGTRTAFEADLRACRRARPCSRRHRSRAPRARRRAAPRRRSCCTSPRRRAAGVQVSVQSAATLGRRPVARQAGCVHGGLHGEDRVGFVRRRQRQLPARLVRGARGERGARNGLGAGVLEHRLVAAGEDGCLVQSSVDISTAGVGRAAPTSSGGGAVSRLPAGDR
jgi:hypothetical protein